MKKRRVPRKLAAPLRELTHSPEERDFQAVLRLIQRGRQRIWTAANLELVELYWAIGQYLSHKVAEEGWGRGTVQRLAAWLAAKEPGLRGFSSSNLWRMRQFFELYASDETLAPLVRQLPWASNLLILGRCKTPEERAFYLRLAIDQRWPSRELERQMEGALFERTVAGQPTLSPALRELHPNAGSVFKDRYLLDFLQLPEEHFERDLQHALVANLKQFLLELGRDFCFVGERYCVQVGTQDFFIDSLFFHRGLQALVAIELKVDTFKPEHLGQLQFYLEALDRNHRKPHEAPSIGVLLCKTRDQEVVEYPLSRSLSPALVAEYATRLPDKALLQAKLDELYELIASERQDEDT
ncbi:MAG TPA: PDDEXK nuclease domain-containing protein [Myxococcaceae bacterium]|jgi:predicted nuclease of restriction endonuclease-like (RecB) superfamily